MLAWLANVRRRLLILALLSGGLLVGAASSQSPAQPADLGKPVVVKTVRPTREPLKREVTQPAQVLPYEQTDVYAKVGGYLQSIDVDLGDRVTKDQVLARIYVPELEKELAQKEALHCQAEAELVQVRAAAQAALAMIRAAKAKLKEAQKDVAKFKAEAEYRRLEWQRYEKLSRDRSISADQADEKQKQHLAASAAAESAEAAVESAEANVQVETARHAKAEADVKSASDYVRVAKANAEQVSTMLDYRLIKAPYTGLVTRRYLHTGAFVQSAATTKPEPLVTLMRVDRLRIVADIPAAEARWVKTGLSASLQVTGLLSKPSGKVTRIADVLDVSTRTLRAEVEVTPIPRDLRPGMFGYLTIMLVNDPRALLVPRAALVLTAEKPELYVAENGRARRRTIDIGFSDDTRVYVTSGLQGDELVIMPDAKNPVRDGQAITLNRDG